MSKKVLIVSATFYQEIAKEMENSAKQILTELGYTFNIVQVPGAFEVPSAIEIGRGKNYCGYIALGCVIRGETTHYDYICTETARALMDLSLKVPLGYGILTCENKKQAEKRMVNKGKSSAIACIRIVEILNEEIK